jgi:hypothetical protein
MPLGHCFCILKIWFALITFDVSGIRSFVRIHNDHNEVSISYWHPNRNIFGVFSGPAVGLVLFKTKQLPSAALTCDLYTETQCLAQL